MLDYYILIKKINGILLKYHKVKIRLLEHFFPPSFLFFFFVFIPILTTIAAIFSYRI